MPAGIRLENSTSEANLVYTNPLRVSRGLLPRVVAGSRGQNSLFPARLRRLNKPGPAALCDVGSSAAFDQSRLQPNDHMRAERHKSIAVLSGAGLARAPGSSDREGSWGQRKAESGKRKAGSLKYASLIAVTAAIWGPARRSRTSLLPVLRIAASGCAAHGPLAAVSVRG
jgi:hypothetical protein